MNEKFKVSINWICDNYIKANNELFNNKLGDCHFKIIPIGERTLGRFYFDVTGDKKVFIDRRLNRLYVKDEFWGDKEWVDSDNFFQLCNPTIAFNSNYSGTYDSLYNTLVHEMCHYYTYMNGYAPKQSHGPEFRNIAQIVSYRSNGEISITRLANKHEMSNYELDDTLKKIQDKRIDKRKINARYFILFFKNGNIGLTNIKDDNLIKKVIDFETKRGTEVFELTDQNIAEELFNRGYSRQFRTYKFWYFKTDDETLKKILITSNKNKLTESKIMKNDIEITSDMDLSKQSPLEVNLTEIADLEKISTKINEINNKKIKKQMKKISKDELRQIIRESIDDELAMMEQRDSSPFGQILHKIGDICEDELIDCGEAINHFRRVFCLNGNKNQCIENVKYCLENYDLITFDENNNLDYENSNSQELCELFNDLIQDSKQLNELYNSTIHNYLKQTKNQKRDIQYKNGIKHAERILDSLKFSVKQNNYTAVFSSKFNDNLDCFILVINFTDSRTKKTEIGYFPIKDGRIMIGNVNYHDSMFEYCVENLRAGERFKFNKLKETIQELNGEEKETLSEKAVSQSQQRFFGMVDAYKKGELDKKDVSKSIKDAADGMTMKQVKDFAKTKHKGLPNHVKKEKIDEVINECLKNYLKLKEKNTNK